MFRVGGEAETPGGDVLGYDFFEARFINGDLAGEQLGDFLLVVVDADDLVPHLREAGARGEPYVTRSDDGDFHEMMTVVLISGKKAGVGGPPQSAQCSRKARK